ncbi:MAG TPA: hypothetical protein VGV09_11955 [Steroidobacteraceae bacterium]|nr:hypothetical protein [Steroidobacteraceae bacterium]
MDTPTVLVATWSNGLFAFQGDAMRQEWAGRSVRGLGLDARGNPLAIIDGNVLCRRAPDGAWHTIARSDVELTCCVAVGAALYVGVNDAPEVMRVRDDGRLERLTGFEQVPGKDRWYAGTALINGQLLGPPLGIRSIAASCDGKALFANVHVGGIPRSTDGGTTWQPTIDVDSDVHQVRPHPSRPEMVIAATGTGLGVSRDGGQTWAIEREGLHACYCSAVAFAGDDILVAASSDHFASQGAIYRRPVDSSGPLTKIEGGLPQWLDGIADTDNISASGATIAVVDHAGKLYWSRDRGHSWSRRGEPVSTPSSTLVYSESVP